MGWLILLAIGAVFGYFYLFGFPGGPKYIVDPKPPKILTPEERIADGYQGAPCEICGGNTGLYDYGSSDQDLICPNCMPLYDVQLRNRRHPPEVIELLDNNPEYEEKLPPEDILMFKTWKKYHIIERQFREGKISEAEYNKRYAENVRWQIDHLKATLRLMKEEEADAARPKYDPRQHSRF